MAERTAVATPSSGTFQRTVEVGKTHSEAWLLSPPPRMVASAPFQPSSASSTGASTNASTHAETAIASIRQELEELRRRRAELEAQRRRLLEERQRAQKDSRRHQCASSTISHNPVWSASGLSSPHHRSEDGSVTAVSASQSASCPHYVDSTVLANVSVIPSEQSRRQHLRPTPQLEAKRALRDAAKHDSTLLMGGFLPEDNPHACTFGRERRFRGVVGQRGKYYLSTDVGVEQLLNRNHLDTAIHQRVAQRYDQTPGPGAYTPRFNKVSQPPRFH